MAGASGGRSLEETPTWAVAVVCFVLVTISIIIEHIIHLIGKWLTKKHKRALYEALEKIKSELMLLGFISLLLTVAGSWISKICIPESVANTWHPCDKEREPELNNEKETTEQETTEHENRRRLLEAVAASGGSIRRALAAGSTTEKCSKYPYNGLEQSQDPERFRFARETSFGRRHLSSWTKTPVLIWIVCFFRQFVRSVPKVDYLTLRHGFITAHLAPQSHTQFNFQKYINRSLEEDFKVVVGISPLIWFFAVVFLLFNTHGWYAYLWLPFIPLIVILLVGTKLQVIITKMGIRIQERGEVLKGVPVVQLGDDLFWFSQPRLILYLINFVLFQFEFGIESCFHEHTEDIVIRITMGVLIQILCSYVTLPLYALVTQMGSNMKPTIFNERVAAALKNWHHTAKKQIKQNKGSVTPLSSRPSTPSYNMSPVHLLRHYRGEMDSVQTSPRRSMEQYLDSESPSPPHTFHGEGSSPHHIEQGFYIEYNKGVNDPGPSQQHEIDIVTTKEFSFDKRTIT
ncbi:MLO-like protein 6 [Citrus sinensis]|uniref:MLO-like protein 6 n=1 Tax=Citrus sinensis TaxID=2711 RepID=A0ACB8IVJ8_CITSI|nr:MLO-like protein 6 [Citrus sinensis]